MNTIAIICTVCAVVCAVVCAAVAGFYLIMLLGNYFRNTADRGRRVARKAQLFRISELEDQCKDIIANMVDCRKDIEKLKQKTDSLPEGFPGDTVTTADEVIKRFVSFKLHDFEQWDIEYWDNEGNRHVLQEFTGLSPEISAKVFAGTVIGLPSGVWYVNVYKRSSPDKPFGSPVRRFSFRL